MPGPDTTRRIALRALMGVTCLLPLSLFGCITETQRRTVSIHAGTAGRIYPAAPYYGQWISGKGILRIQRPPRPAMSLTPRSRTYRAAADDYKIESIRRNVDGSDSFLLVPVTAGLKRKLTLKIENRNMLRETGNRPTLWRRMGSTAP